MITLERQDKIEARIAEGYRVYADGYALVNDAAVQDVTELLAEARALWARVEAAERELRDFRRLFRYRIEEMGPAEGQPRYPRIQEDPS